ncbi:hypothetical protein FEM48_Zijuj05G0124500 [Ziziphus jujuba var. spinosa]|uniref:Uncharacterized protein n=1 Tax=Ziziphus jujuba var. spinosa TaxID=714518 RepID=A0A978VET9_ZIZJJ|nr:hypothetical protein FEM48_Zijuj05G0124500 [Ziziphus jujuba var. spinosa]
MADRKPAISVESVKAFLKSEYHDEDKWAHNMKPFTTLPAIIIDSSDGFLKIAASGGTVCWINFADEKLWSPDGSVRGT